MTGRLRVILPPAAALGTFAFAFAATEGPLAYAEWRWGGPANPTRPSVAVVKFAAVLYAAFRVLAYHPFYRPGYRGWLELTPWTSRSPLPVGPPHVVWEDGFVVGGLAALALALPPIDPVRLVCMVLLWWSVCLAVTFWPTGAPGFGYATAFLAGLAVRLYPDRWAYLAATVATYAVAYAGLSRSLARFPWPLPLLKELSATGGAASHRLDAWNGPQCGWPYDLLRPLPPHPLRFGFRDAVLASILAGWWLFAWQSLFTNPFDRSGVSVIVFSFGSMAFVLGRFLLYRVGYAPPISLWGRLATLNWVIPGYDQVYVGPAAAAALGVVTFGGVLACGLGYEEAGPVGLGVVMLVTLTAAPGLTRWRLTGRHRLAFGAVNQQNKTEFVRAG